MPTYEYACAACGHAWEQVQRITEPPVEVCPKCAASAAHRLISGGTNFILKGGGWYSDLYSTPKSSSKEPEAKGETAPSSPAKSDKSDAAAPSANAAPSPPAATPPPTSSTPSS